MASQGPPKDPEPRQLHPLPRGLVELYGLMAVLFVLVPEWMAGGALFSFRDGRQGSELPVPSGAWRRLPELDQCREYSPIQITSESIRLSFKCV